MNFSNNKNFISYIIIILFSIFLSVAYSIEQRAVDDGLILSNTILYPERHNIMQIFSNNVWTFLFQFTGTLLKLDFSIMSISRIILFLSTFFYSMGIYLVSKSITSSSIISLFICFVVIIFQKSFGSIDYPTMIFSEHTNGMMSLAIVTLIFGLVANKNLLLAIFFSIFLICIHLTVGMWIASVLILSLFISKFVNKNNFEIKPIIYSALFAFFFVIVSFIFYYLNLVELNNKLDESAYSTYMQVWDMHRNNFESSILNYKYIVLSLLLIFLILFSFKYLNIKKNSSNHLMLLILFLSTFLSMIIYLAYKLLPFLFPDILIRAMPTRFFLMQSVIGIPVIISIIYLFLIKFLINKKINISYGSYIIFSILLIFSINHFDKILIIKDHFLIHVAKNKNNYENKNFWKKVKNYHADGYILTSYETCRQTLRRTLKPVLLCAESIDNIPYIPKSVNYVKEIIEDVFDVPFNNPPIKYAGGLIGDVIKKNYQKKMTKDWKKISSKFRVTALIVPKDWIIALEPKFIGKDYIYYSITE